MPSVNLSKETYEDLQRLMALEIKNKLQHNKDILQLVKNKFGITFDSMIRKLIFEYKKHHKT